MPIALFCLSPSPRKCHCLLLLFEIFRGKLHLSTSTKSLISFWTCKRRIHQYCFLIVGSQSTLVIWVLRQPSLEYEKTNSQNGTWLLSEFKYLSQSNDAKRRRKSVRGKFFPRIDYEAKYKVKKF